MSVTFSLDRSDQLLFDGAGREFDLDARRWKPASRQASGELFALQEAVRWLQRETPYKIRVPVGVIGPREASPEQMRMAEAVGAGLADMGFFVICGGRGGVMEATCNGVRRAGGLAIGLLPEADLSTSNRYVGVALGTGIGEARNVLIANAALCLVAVGDSFGTLSEVALGRQFGKTVIGLAGAASVDGVIHVATPEEALDEVARDALALRS
jgi:uncharacterized protein (TIGR00725 family)